MFPTKQDTGGLRVPVVSFTGRAPGGKIILSSSYQRHSAGALDHNGFGNLIIDTVSAVFDNYDAHFTFAGNNCDFLAAVAP